MENLFGIVDYIVFSLMLIISACIGIYFNFSGGKQKTTDEILLGDRNMSPIPVAFSIMATTISAVGLIIVPVQVYLYGFIVILFGFGYLIAAPIIIYIYHPVFFNMEVTSVNEYLNRRFGKLARYLGSLIFILNMFFYMATVLYAPAVALSAVTGISKWAAITSVGFICTFYCILGGMKAVLWTDLFQALIMYGTIFTLLIKGCRDVGGVTNVWKIASEGKRTEFLPSEFELTEMYSFWPLLFGSVFYSISNTAVSQIQVQRMVTVKSIKKSRLAILVSALLVCIYLTCLCFCGLVIYADLVLCDPILNKQQSDINSFDQLFPYYIMITLGNIPGLPGLCVAGLSSASISTLSSGLNSLAAVTLKDYIYPNCPAEKLDERKAAIIVKLLVLLYGIICIAMSYLVEQFGGIVQVTLIMFGALSGPLVGVFTLGMLFRRPNEKGVIIGFLIASSVICWLAFGATYSGFTPAILPLSVEECADKELITSVLNNSVNNFNNFTSFLIETITVSTELDNKP